MASVLFYFFGFCHYHCACGGQGHDDECDSNHAEVAGLGCCGVTLAVIFGLAAGGVDNSVLFGYFSFESFVAEILAAVGAVPICNIEMCIRDRL